METNKQNEILVLLVDRIKIFLLFFDEVAE